MYYVVTFEESHDYPERFQQVFCNRRQAEDAAEHYESKFPTIRTATVEQFESKPYPCDYCDTLIQSGSCCENCGPADSL